MARTSKEAKSEKERECLHGIDVDKKDLAS